VDVEKANPAIGKDQGIEQAIIVLKGPVQVRQIKFLFFNRLKIMKQHEKNMNDELLVSPASMLAGRMVIFWLLVITPTTA
jgi:hypothetical protein